MTPTQPDTGALTAAHAALSPLALHALRSPGALVGRPVEQTAMEQELAAAGSGRLAGVTLEGEPGIGKTRLLLAAGEMATARGFTTIGYRSMLRASRALSWSLLSSANRRWQQVYFFWVRSRPRSVLGTICVSGLAT